MEPPRIFPQVRALVAAVHQLANAGRGGGDHAGRQRGGEDIGAADQPHDLELRVVGNAEAADRADAFRESADDEIDILDHALFLAHAAAVLADEAHRVGLVHQHHRAVFLRDRDHFLQRGDIAQHRVDAFEHDQLARAFGNAAQALFHRVEIVVLERHDFRLAHRAPVPDAGVAVDVEDDVVALARDGRDDPEIGLVAGGEDHRVVHRVEFAQRVLALPVALIGPVEHAAAGRPAAEIGQRLLARGDDVGIEGHPHVIVGAEQDRVAPVADRAGGGEDFLHHQVEGVFLPAGEQPFAHRDQIVELAEQVGRVAFAHLRPVGLADSFAHASACILWTASTSWP